jgi:ABC-type spermidine/putrescine transport system permease subunit II
VKTIGVISTVVTSAIAVLAAVVVVRAMPDIRRYLKIRTMYGG